VALKITPLNPALVTPDLKLYRCLCNVCRVTKVIRPSLTEVDPEEAKTQPRADQIFYSSIPLKDLACPWTGVKGNLIALSEPIHHLVQCEHGPLSGNRSSGTAHYKYRIACSDNQDPELLPTFYTSEIEATTCPQCLCESLPPDIEWVLPLVTLNTETDPE
jgi:hypothetical protein